MFYKIIFPAFFSFFCGAAFPQSSISIFGTVDLGIVHSNNGNSILPGSPPTSGFHLMPGARSRIGFRGTEDLGNGLRANFVLETSFTPDNGQPMSNTNFWHAQSWVGIAGQFGEIRFGRDYAPGHLVASRADPFTFDTVGQVGISQAWAGYTANGGASRMNNGIYYRSPTINGWSAQIATGFSEVHGVRNEYGASITYAKNGWYVGTAYDSKDVNLGKNDLAIATLAYQFGKFLPRISYSRAHVLSQSRINLTVGASYQLPSSEIRVVYARQTVEKSDDTRKIALGYHYRLSKRSKIYTDLAQAKTGNYSRKTAWDFGIQHNF